MRGHLQIISEMDEHAKYGNGGDTAQIDNLITYLSEMTPEEVLLLSDYADAIKKVAIFEMRNRWNKA